MVQTNETQQAFYDTNGHGPITADDVCLVVDRQVTDETIAERFEGVDLLPDYVAEAGRRLYLWRGSDRVSEDEFMAAARRLTSGPSRDEDRARTLATMRALAREGFELNALLKDEDGFDADASVLARFHAEARPAATGIEGVVDYVATYQIPACAYLQYLWDGCEALSAPPFNADAYVLPTDREDGYDLICGWTGCQAGGRMEYAVRNVTDDDAGRRLFLRMLAKFLLDVHLHDVRIVTYDGGAFVTAATHAVAALWVRLTQSLGTAHVGTCRVCGKPFVAKNERRWKTRYCQANGACAKAYARTKVVLGGMADGKSFEEAVAETRNIGPSRVIEIVRRNRHILREEYPQLDLDQILKE